MKTVRVRGLILLGCVSLASCSIPSTPPPANTVTLSPTTKVLSQGDTTLIRNVSSDQSTVTFSGTSATVSSLHIGDVLVTGVSSQTPTGLLRKVTAIANSGDQVVVSTTQATIEDAIQSGTLSVDQQLTTSNMQSAQVKASKGVLLSAGVVPRGTTTLPSFHFAVQNVVLLDADGDPTTTSDDVVANGTLDISAELVLDATLQSNKLSFANFKLISTESTQLSVSMGSQVTFQKQIEIATVPFSPMVIPLGTFPLVILPVLHVYVGFQGTAGVSVTTSVQQSITVTDGVTYNSNTGQWTPVSDIQPSLNFTPPTLSGNLSAQAYVSPALVANFYGVAGPTFSLKGYLELDASTSANPWWTLYGGLSGSVGIYFTVLSDMLQQAFNVGLSVQVLDYRWPLAQASGPSGWSDSFDTYATGSFPSTSWTGDGNASDSTSNYVDSTRAWNSTKSLRLYGVVGGDWAALAYRPLTISSPLDIQADVYNGTEVLSGTHPGRGYIGLRQGFSWSNPSRQLVYFDQIGNIEDTSGNVLQSYSTATWYHVEVIYSLPTSSTVSISYFINGTSRGTVTVAAQPAETTFANLELTVEEGSAWFDNVQVGQ